MPDIAATPAAPTAIKIVEVGPRDGLQNEKSLIDTPAKLAFITQLAQAGLKFIEVTSFVHPQAIPQLADAQAVAQGLPELPGVRFSALVPNLKGLERALAAGIRDIAVFTAASNTFTQHNIRMTIEESLATFEPVVARALQAGMGVRGYVSTAFYCPYEGKIGPTPVLDVTQRLLKLGVQEVSIGDTIGQANPVDVTETMRRLLGEVPVSQLAMHFHDTNGLALENVDAALALGLRTFDASAGGLGGCPYAPGASGNLSTDALVAHLHACGYTTGVDPAKLAEASRSILQAIENSRDVFEGLAALTDFGVQGVPAPNAGNP